MNNDQSHEKKTIDNIIVEGQSTVEKLNCVICYTLPYQPQYLNCCEQIICLNCIEECLSARGECPFCKNKNPTYQTPNKFIMRTFDEVIMKCRFVDKGCEEKMNYSNILEHEKKCEKNPNKNTNNNPANSINSQQDFSLKYNNEFLLVYIDMI